MPSPLITTARTGLSVWAFATAVRIAVATSSGPATTGGTKSTINASTAGSASSSGEHRLVRRRGRRAEEVDRVRGARLRREHARERRSGFVAECGQLQAGRLARVGAEDPEPAGVRHHGDVPAARERLRREQGGGVDQLLERPRAQHPGLVEERVRCGVGACERRGMRARGPRARPGRARLEREDRLATGDAACDPPELPAGSRRTRDRGGQDRSRGRSPTIRGDRWTRRRPCCRPRRRPRSRAAAPPPARAARGRGRRSATRSRCGPSGNALGAKVALSPRPVAAIPRQFGPTSLAPCSRTSASRRSCAAAPSSPVSANPDEMTQSARVPCRSALAAASSTRVAGTQMTARSTGSGISSIER